MTPALPLRHRAPLLPVAVDPAFVVLLDVARFLRAAQLPRWFL